MRLFGSDRIAGLMEKLGLEEGQELSHPLLTSSIEKAQKRVEQQHFGIRKRTLEYDDVMNKQRAAIYGLRHEILTTEDTRKLALDFVRDAVTDRVEEAFNAKVRNEPVNLSEVRNWLERTVPVTWNDADFSHDDATALVEAIMARVDEAYALKEQAELPEDTRFLERFIMLNAIDNLYQAHLYNMDDLRQNVQLRSYGQRDPLVEYKQEAFKIYQTLMVGIKDAVVTNLFRLTVHRNPPAGSDQSTATAPTSALPRPPLPEASRPASYHTLHQQLGQFEGTAAGRPAQPAQPQTIHRETPKVGRNDPCPCGSGKKFKNCHGR